MLNFSVDLTTPLRVIFLRGCGLSLACASVLYSGIQHTDRIADLYKSSLYSHPIFLVCLTLVVIWAANLLYKFFYKRSFSNLSTFADSPGSFFKISLNENFCLELSIIPFNVAQFWVAKKINWLSRTKSQKNLGQIFAAFATLQAQPQQAYITPFFVSLFLKLSQKEKLLPVIDKTVVCWLTDLNKDNHRKMRVFLHWKALRSQANSFTEPLSQ